MALIDPRLLGEWIVDHLDAPTVERFGHARIDIDGDQLVYQFEDGGRALLRIEESSEGVLVTNQPSAPRREKTQYAFDDSGTLTLTFRGFSARFKRAD